MNKFVFNKRHSRRAISHPILAAMIWSIASSCGWFGLEANTLGQTSPTSTQRHFQFHYAASLIDLSPGAEVKVWIPIAESNPHQEVKLLSVSTPAPMETNRDPDHQNLIGFFKLNSNAGEVAAFQINYDVHRKTAAAYQDTRSNQPSTLQKYLSANRLVPIDGKPVDLIKKISLPKRPREKSKALYDFVFNHMNYDKSKPGYGHGDSVWACDSQTGNCTDFHSLFISMARSQEIAARFEIGFPLPPTAGQGKIGGYHCWAWFVDPEKGWVPVDISEADKHPENKEALFGQLPPDRIAFSTGRDIRLAPASSAQPLNYFVYPHVEVDGKIWPKEKIKLNFSYQDR